MLCPHYSCISKRAKTVNATFKMKHEGSIQHLIIDLTGFKAYGEIECKVKSMVLVGNGESGVSNILR
ncbi:transposase [Candidatus Enterovibrio altilux]|uniref:Mobile element protein n=1 Tax=Candidatus Enterovibrio altilux TaxID=1927128 RepID=A0A291B8C9_9GAMM|nr:transposase [Candidatus Enterovibrio luxaltus]ATF09227.1 Mobile element protein [Candidatus Enterovibrio luxaltus]